MENIDLNRNKHFLPAFFKWCGKIILIVVVVLILNYLVIYAKSYLIVHNPINIKNENITRIEMSYYDCDTEKKYSAQVSEKEQIQNIINKVNDINVVDEGSYGAISNIFILEFYDEDKPVYWIRVVGRKVILGEESYVMKEKDRAKLNGFVLDIIEKSDNYLTE